jgi:CsoR family transcriptional regulator, copper-sensing transcriptional repressor
MKLASKKKPVVGRPESSAANLPDDMRADLDSRLARIEGHVSAIRRMLSSGEDCDSLLVQASAVRAALNGVLVGLMEAHFESCVVPCARAGVSDEAIGRFRQALETVLKRS